MVLVRHAPLLELHHLHNASPPLASQIEAIRVAPEQPQSAARPELVDQVRIQLQQCLGDMFERSSMAVSGLNRICEPIAPTEASTPLWFPCSLANVRSQRRDPDRTFAFGDPR
jgi:hypothetical protein